MDFSASHTVLPVRDWGGTRCWKGTQSGQLAPADRRDVQYHMAPCSVSKAGEKRRKGGCSAVWYVFLSNHCECWSMAFLEMAKIWLPIGSNEWIPYLDLFTYVPFASPVKQPLSQFLRFLTFTFPISSTSDRSEQQCEQIFISVFILLWHHNPLTFSAPFWTFCLNFTNIFFIPFFVLFLLCLLNFI